MLSAVDSNEWSKLGMLSAVDGNEWSKIRHAISSR